MSKRRAGVAASTPSTKISHNSVSASSSDATKAIRRLVSASLETWCHHLLYVRRIYPSNSFANSYFLGLRVKANRHPAVVAYISRAVEVAVPALTGSNRVADEFSFEVVNEVVNSTQISENSAEANQPIIAGRKKSEEALNLGKEAQSLAFSSCSSPKFPNPVERQKAQKAPQNSQSSMSSLSTTAVQQQKQSQESEQKNNSQDSEEVATIVATRSRSSLGEGNDSQVTTTSHSTSPQQQQQQQPLESTSVEVLERFSLFFSAPLEPHNVSSNTPKNSSCAGGGVVADIEDGIVRRNHKRRKGANGTTTREESSAQLKLLELERAFRHLILNLSNVKRDRVLPSSSLSFKLVLHVNDQQRVCPQIEKAFDSGSWYPCSSETERVAQERRLRLPLYQVDVEDCKIRFQMQRKKKHAETGGS